MEIKEESWPSEAAYVEREEGGYVRRGPGGAGCAHQHG